MTTERKNVMLRVMEIGDYQEVYELWRGIEGFVIRPVEDSREGVEQFLRRNPATSVVALDAGRIVGSILCGHDGRQGSLYHVCVDKDYRKKGIGKKMVRFCMDALKREGIRKVHLIAFTRNDVGNTFWKSLDWESRKDVNYYTFEKSILLKKV